MARPADPSLSRGLSRRYVDTNGVIIGPAWYRAFENRDIVGTCRQMGCDGLLVVAPTESDDEDSWYSATCLSCWHEVVSLNGNTLPRSTRRHEMPDGAWDRRDSYLKKMNAFAKNEG